MFHVLYFPIIVFPVNVSQLQNKDCHGKINWFWPCSNNVLVTGRLFVQQYSSMPKTGLAFNRWIRSDNKVQKILRYITKRLFRHCAHESVCGVCIISSMHFWGDKILCLPFVSLSLLLFLLCFCPFVFFRYLCNCTLHVSTWPKYPACLCDCLEFCCRSIMITYWWTMAYFLAKYWHI